MQTCEIQKNLTSLINQAIVNISKKFLPQGLSNPPKIELEIPSDSGHGDFTTNIAMRLAGVFSTNGLNLANLIKTELEELIGRGNLLSAVSKIQTFPPGFINFSLGRQFLYENLFNICKEKSNFGKSTFSKGVRVNIEFVSANPTGPLTVAHGRQAAIGDALGRILAFSGYDVSKEYFINDIGVQIELLGKSIYARYLDEYGVNSEFPENGYQGAYIVDIAKLIKDKYGKDLTDNTPRNLKFISQFGVSYIMKLIKDDLKEFGVFFNKWFSQETLSDETVHAALNILREKGYIYEKEGAVWFKSTSFGDDKDRVVIKSDGTFTYLAPDVAYHKDKFERGFNKLINIWGPDHHGYIPRLTASIEALGYDKKNISILIVQLATLFRNGIALSMSTRKGEFISLREVMNEVGRDVTKFFFLMRKLDSHLDFDLEVAKKTSMDNPVYYIQYGHARIASIMGFSRKLRFGLSLTKYDPALLREPEETLLLRMISHFPLVVEKSASSLEPYRIIEYLNTLAKIFHSYYNKHRVVTDNDLRLTKARLTLVQGVKIVLANGLNLLGISFPERM